MERYNHGSANDAVECFDRAIEIFGKDVNKKRDLADTYRDKGFAHGKIKGHDKDAIQCFKKSTETEPEYPYAWNSLGYYILNTQQNDNKAIKEAIEYFDKAIALEPNFSYAYYNKGYALYSLKQYEEAIEYFDKAIALEPNFSYAWNTKGYALTSLERYNEAIKCFDKDLKIRPELASIEVEPKFDYVSNTKGYALYSLKRYTEAIECFDKILSKPYSDKASEINRAYFIRGQSKFMLEDYVGALEDFTKINDTDLDDTKTNETDLKNEKHNNIGLCYQKQNLFEEAEREYLEAINSTSQRTKATAYYNLGVL